MDEQATLERIRSLIDEIGAPTITRPADLVFRSQRRWDTDRELNMAIKRLRDAAVKLRNVGKPHQEKVTELACLVGELAFKWYPENHFILNSYCNALNLADRADDAITLITEFLKAFPDKRADAYLAITLSSSYKHKNEYDRATEVLEKFPKDPKPEGVVRQLAEYYLTNSEPAKAIEAVAGIPLNHALALLLGRALRDLQRRKEAMQVTEHFKDFDDVRKFREELGSDPTVKLPTDPIGDLERDRNEKLVYHLYISGDFVGRDKIGRDKADGDIVHRDKITKTHSGVSGDDISKLFAALQAQLQSAPTEVQERALQDADALREEIEKGEEAQDETLAGLLQNIVDDVPDAAKSLAALFVPEPVARIAGAATKFVLSRLRK